MKPSITESVVTREQSPALNEEPEVLASLAYEQAISMFQKEVAHELPVQPHKTSDPNPKDE